MKNIREEWPGVKMSGKMEGARSSATHMQKCIGSSLLTALTIIGIVLGITFGFVLRNYREDTWSQREQTYAKFGGEIFLQMLKALSLPLILSSVIAALGSLDLRLSGKVGMRTFLFYLLTTVCAVFLGIVLVIIIHPGSRNNNVSDVELGAPKTKKVSNVMMDIARNMFPANLVQATLYQYETIVETPTSNMNHRNEHHNETLRHPPTVTKSSYSEGTNMLGLLVFSTIFGMALASMGSYGKPVLKLVRCVSQLMMVISTWVLWLAPVGIFCLLTGRILDLDNLKESLAETKMYVFTVLTGLLLHGFVVLPGVYYLISGSHPFKIIANSGQALVTAFGTSSSIAALPATVACVEEKHGVDPRVARFVLPVGAAMNMDGTALYEAVAACFLMQLHGVSMDFGSIVAVSFIATVASVGASGIPHAGIVTMTMLMDALDLPVEYIALLISVDWVLHRFRTTINVLGDVLAANLVDNASKDDLEQYPVEKVISKERKHRRCLNASIA